MKDLAIAATAAALGGAGVILKRLNRNRQTEQVQPVTDVVVVYAVLLVEPVGQSQLIKNPSKTRAYCCENESRVQRTMAHCVD